jgi:hypothetical protein
MKRLVVCCDGTWQDLATNYPTNVVKIMQAITPNDQDNIPQLVFYDEGVGTAGTIDKFIGGAFGWGLSRNVMEGYRFLCLNYEAGDEIYLFGFSRGAYTVRSIVGMISHSGILPRVNVRLIPIAYQYYKDKTALKPTEIEQLLSKTRNNIPIKFLGCWDTVGALGIPDKIPDVAFSEQFNEKYQFHDCTLSSIVEFARHAIAIDEPRKEFDFTPMELKDQQKTNLKQVLFPGSHGCVGGGSENEAPLSNNALLWMIEEVKQVTSLEFDQSLIERGINCNETIPFNTKINYLLYHKQLREFGGNRDNWQFEDLHESVKQRWQKCPWYRPENLGNRIREKLEQHYPIQELKSLSQGESFSFAVLADARINHSGVRLETGKKYQFIVSPDDTWTDGDIVTNARGWTVDKQFSWLRKQLINHSESSQILPEANWFELIGEILISSNESVLFRIGDGGYYTASHTGELSACANDLPLMYWNNSGYIWLKVLRVD